MTCGSGSISYLREALGLPSCDGVRPQEKKAALTGQEIAFTILRDFEQARVALVGKTVVLSDGKAGTIDRVFLDELHGLRMSIAGYKGRWPISPVTFLEA